jgi:hypothetical protein
VSLVDHALTYAASGTQVFPLKPDKTPYTEHGMKEATTSAATITTWWRRWPVALIGARIPVDVVVLDIDVRHGGDATVRVPFPRPALDERDARSHLTMLSQLAWEAERNYQPVVPAAVGGGGAVAAAPQ